MTSVENIPASEYHARPGVSSTYLRALALTPLDGKRATEGFRDATRDMNIGTTFHSYSEWLGNGMAADRFPFDDRTKVPSDHLKSESGQAKFSAEMQTIMPKMYAGLTRCETAMRILRDGVREVSIFADVEGVPGKARLDSCGEIVADLKKTVKSADRQTVIRTICNYRYDLQDAWYRRLVNIAIDKQPEPRVPFVFIMTEYEEPYKVAVYELDNDWLRAADREISDLLNLHKKCTNSGLWPGYPDEVVPLARPKWMTPFQE